MAHNGSDNDPVTRYHMNKPLRGRQTLPETPVAREDRRDKAITRVCSREELGLPPAPIHKPYTPRPSEGTNIGFLLTDAEHAFIEKYAEQWNLSYDEAVVKVIHDGLDLLRKSFALVEMYENTRYNK